MLPENLKIFFNESDLETEIVEGDVERVIYTGEEMQIISYSFPPNKVFPLHSHEDNEQMGYLVKGKMGFRIGDTERILLPGDFYHAPKGIIHNGWTLDKPSVLLDFFAPPREDLVK